MTRHVPPFVVRLATDADDLTAARRLRYSVFVEELGGQGGPETDPDLGVEGDGLDAHCDHLLLVDPLHGGEVVGTARLLPGAAADGAGGFAAEGEFDLSALRSSGRPLLEVGRICLDPRVRAGSALHALWQGIAAYAARSGTGVLFGLASLPTGDAPRLVAGMERRYLAPPHLRPRSLRPIPTDDIEPTDRRALALGLPPLVKAYLRMGGNVGTGGYHDPAFGCVDVCMVLDAARLAPAARRLMRDAPP